MPAAYITAEAANARLESEYRLEDAAVNAAEVLMASDELDDKRGFVGCKLDEDQHREFPRTPAVRDDEEEETPQAILDWVALRAYELSNDHDPTVKSERLKSLSVVYRQGRRPRTKILMRALLRPYRLSSYPIGT